MLLNLNLWVTNDFHLGFMMYFVILTNTTPKGTKLTSKIIYLKQRGHVANKKYWVSSMERSFKDENFDT